MSQPPKAPRTMRVSRPAKRALDLVLASVAVLLLSPILLLTALAILITMGRPVLFVQERVGRNGAIFRMLKFRSMVTTAEQEKELLWEQNEAPGPAFKIRVDPRATPVGRVLRALYLDELPQLFHVLSGRMSLVGPRPLPVNEQAQVYGWHRRRLEMQPGITGTWQISDRDALNFDDWMQLDVDYVEHWSLMLDLRVLLRTVGVVLAGGLELTGTSLRSRSAWRRSSASHRSDRSDSPHPSPSLHS